MSSALEHTYRYAFPSALLDRGGRLRLATSGGAEEHPYFFRGAFAFPKRAADLLRALMKVVQSRFHIPPQMVARLVRESDPVVTCSEGRLRLEGFSACCGAYARVDLLPNAVDGEFVGRGTTNVDFNAPMLAALAKIRDRDQVAISVGADEVCLEAEGKSIVEKRVRLPLRWLKGFAESQAFLARMSCKLETDGLEAKRFLASLPRTQVKTKCWVVRAGRGLRLSQRFSTDGVEVGGVERLRVLETLVSHADTLRVYADEASGASAWELLFGEARYTLAISPDVWRGFSGEGQLLLNLAEDEQDDGRDALAHVRAALTWESAIDLPAVAKKSGIEVAEATRALAALSARGLVGYDLDLGAHFHRELPFDMSLVDELQPRLLQARQLIERGKIRAGDNTHQFFVASDDVTHRVQFDADDNENAKCTCVWYARHQGQRGPCKHILASRILLERSL